MTQHSDWIVGIDLGDRTSVFARMDKVSAEIQEGSFRMTPEAVRKQFEPWERQGVVMEAGGQSRWVGRLLSEMGFNVMTANPRQLPLISQSFRKNDRNDALTLARLGAFEPKLLKQVHHRSDEMQADLSVAQARQALVETRTKLILTIRGMAKSMGERIRMCDARCFKSERASVPEVLRPALDPLFDVLDALETKIRAYDRKIEAIFAERYPEAKELTEIRGVGSLTALVFVLSLGDAKRFKRSRDAAAFLGLCPRQHESGSLRKELGITKAGNGFARRLLVQAAHYILGHFGEDCDLRRWGLRLYERGGKCAKKRAAVAVARKLAVVMHRLYVSQDEYRRLRDEPLAA